MFEWKHTDDDDLVRVYNQPNCPETGNVNFWTYTQGDDNNKFGQNVRSYRFL